MFLRYDGSTIHDDHTIDITLSEPYAPFQLSLGDVPIVSEPDPRWEGKPVVLDGAVPSATDADDHAIACPHYDRLDAELEAER